MSDKIKEILQTPEVPEELLPENISAFIKRKNIKQQKNRNIKVIKYVSALTACVMITVCAVQFMPQKQEDLYQIETNQNNYDEQSISEDIYFKNIVSYEEVYGQMKKNYKKEKTSSIFGDIVDGLFGGKKYTNKSDNMIYEESEIGRAHV